jgi:hypothetical protein
MISRISHHQDSIFGQSHLLAIAPIGPQVHQKMLGHCDQKNVNFDNYWKGVPNPPAQMYLKTSQPSLHILLNVISITGSYNRITLIFIIFLGAIQLSSCHCIATVMAENIAQSPHLHLIHFYQSINFDSQSGPIGPNCDR